MGDPGDVLDVQRLIEAELRAEPVEVLAIGVGAQHDLGGVAGGQVQHEEHDHRDPEQHGSQMQEPAREEADHCRFYRRLTASTRRSKLGWSLKPCTRFEVAAIWIS
jgi:hypothetical protein